MSVSSSDSLHRPISASASASKQTTEAVASRPIDLRGVQLLLAEDNEINSEIACELLSSLGARIDVAQNGEDAVAQLLASPADHYHAVLMDVQMPEMDGLEATRIVRAHPTLNSLPIIAMTAHASAEERARCLSAGMNDHVAKPIDPALLFNTISRWVGRMEGQAALHEKHGALPSIDGLDTAEGLSRTMGDAMLYRDLLQRFLLEQREAAQRIRETIATDRAKAYRGVHTMKSVAGLIGAMPVETLATRLEQAIESGEPDHHLAAHVEQLAQALDRLCAALQVFFEAQSGQDAAL